MSIKNNNKVNKAEASKKAEPIIDNSIANYEAHPFFVKKANAAKALLSKVGIPKQLQKEAHT